MCFLGAEWIICTGTIKVRYDPLQIYLILKILLGISIEYYVIIFSSKSLSLVMDPFLSSVNSLSQKCINMTAKK